MKLIIEIPEDTKTRLCFGITYQKDIQTVCEALNNGTSLPKGHGRLIDADEIQFENAEFDTYGDYSRAFDAIDEAETIIEADKAESEDKE